MAWQKHGGVSQTKVIYTPSTFSKNLNDRTMKLNKQTNWVLIVGLLLAGLIFNFLWNQQKTLWEEKFFNQVQREMTILKGRLEVNERILLGVRSLFEASNHVELYEFKTYVTPII